MAVTTAELKAILSLQDQMTAQLRTVKSELQGLGHAVNQAGTHAQSGGMGFMKLTAAMAAGQVAASAFMGILSTVAGKFMQAGQASTDFGQSMANIRAMVPTADFEKYGAATEKLALRLGKDYPLSASEAGKAIETLVQKGTSLEKINQGAAEAVVKLSAATGGDLVTAAEVVNAALDTFNMSADDTVKVTSVMTGAMLNGGMTLNDFKYAMTSAGTVVHMMGGNVEDLSIAIAAMAKAGIEGSDAGTSYKSMLMNLQPSTKEQIALFRELGITTADGSNKFFDAEGKVKSYEEQGRVLADALEGMTEKQRQATLEIMFGTDGIRAAAIAARVAKGDFGDLGAAVRSVDPEEVAKKRMDSLAGSLKQFGGSAETIGIILVGKLGPAMKNVVDVGTELLNRFLSFLETETAGVFFDRMAAGVQTLVGELESGSASIFAFGNTLMAWGPLGEVAGLALQSVSLALEGLAKLLKGDVKGAADSFVNALGPMGRIAERVGELIGWAAARFSEAATFIGQAAQKAGETGGWMALQRALQQVVALGQDIKQRNHEIAEAMDRLRRATGIAADPIDVLAAALRGMALGIEYAVIQVRGFVDTIGAGIAILVNYTTGLSRVGQALQQLQRGDLPGAWESLQMANFAFVAGTQAAEGFRQRGLERLAAQTRILGDVMNGGMGQVARSVEAGMAQAEAAVAQGSSGMQQFMEANVTGMVGAIEAAGPQMAAAAGDGTVQAIAAVEGQSGAAASAGHSVGSNLGSGLFDGISAWVGSIASAAANLVRTAIRAAQAEGQIESPSKKMKEQVGKPLAQGVAAGIAELAPEVAREMRELIDAAAAYTPVAGEIARVEREIKDLRERGSREALFREEELVTITSEQLRLKEQLVRAERDLLPLKRDVARAAREIADAERGSLAERQYLIEIDGKRKELRLQELELERQLVGLDRDSKRAKALQEQIDKLRDQDRLLALEAEKIRLTNEISTTGARVRKEALDAQLEGENRAIEAIREAIEVLDAEKSVFEANEAVIKNATENEIKYRERLIEVFKAEGKPLRDRIEAGMALIDQLKEEGVISDELANKLKEVARKALEGAGAAQTLGEKAGATKDPLSEAAQKAAEMARQAAQIAQNAGDAADEMSELAKEAAEYARNHGSLFDPRPRRRHSGGPVQAGVPYLVGKDGSEELFIPNQGGMILSHEATRSLMTGTDGASLPSVGPRPGTGVTGAQIGRDQIRIFIGQRELDDWFVETLERVEKFGRD